MKHATVCTKRITHQQISDALSKSEMTNSKRTNERVKKSSATKKVKDSKTKGVKDSSKVLWVRNDNCCLLYAMWEIMTKQQQELLTVSDFEALFVEISVVK